MVRKDEYQEYARVTKLLGNRRLTCECFDGKIRLGKIRGKMKKRVWISVDDLVLISKRDFQDSKCDVIHRYSSNEERLLKKQGEFENYVDKEKEKKEEEEDLIAFEDI